MTAALARLPDWRLRFDSFVYGRLHEPFRWGENDCGLFALDAVREITGSDLSEGFRFHRSALEARRLLQPLGGLRGAAVSLFGEPVEVEDTRQGDLLLVEMRGRHALGVRVSECRVVGPGPEGLHIAPVSCATVGWRIG